jgi:hypothetical protein
MRIVEVFGDGRQLPNGWHRYIETHVGTKWAHLLHPQKLRLLRIRKSIYTKLPTREVGQDWEWYRFNLTEMQRIKTMNERKFANSEVNRVLAYIEAKRGGE